jgi:hypothetical protein
MKTNDILYNFTAASNDTAKCKYCSVSYSYKVVQPQTLVGF